MSSKAEKPSVPPENVVTENDRAPRRPPPAPLNLALDSTNLGPVSGTATPAPIAPQAQTTDLGPLAQPPPPMVASQTFERGERIANRYLVERLLGRGGMGEVYEVQDLELNERVALKTLLPELASDEQVIQRFRQEVRLARRVTHPNVCRLFDLGFHADERNGVPREVTYLTMEFVEGEPLSSRLHRDGRLTPGQAMPIAEQLCQGIAAAHAAGIIHRDLKSSNVLLKAEPTGGFRVLISDFGIARPSKSEAIDLTRPNAVIGTPAYMAPELVKGGRATVASDVYALGVVLHELLTAELPFFGAQPVTALARRLSEPAPSARTRIEGVPPDWDRTILHCLERDPDRRPPGALAVLDSLHGRISEPPKPRSRLPLGLACAGAILAVAATLGWVLRDPLPSRDRKVSIVAVNEGPGPDAALASPVASLLATRWRDDRHFTLVPAGADANVVATVRFKRGGPGAELTLLLGTHPGEGRVIGSAAAASASEALATLAPKAAALLDERQLERPPGVPDARPAEPLQPELATAADLERADFEAAIWKSSSALWLYGVSTDRLVAHCDVLLAADRRGEARAIADQLIALGGRSRHLGLFRMGVLGILDGRFGAARESLKAALEAGKDLGPESQAPRITESLDAIEALTSALTTAADCPAAQRMVLSKGPGWDTARRLFQRSAAASGCVPCADLLAGAAAPGELGSRPLLELGLCAEREGSLELAAGLLKRAAVAWSPTRSAAISPLHGVLSGYHLGRVQAKLGQNADAAASYQTFLAHWEKADVALPEIAEAQAALKRLAATSAGSSDR